MIFIGIDPGLTGALAFLQGDRAIVEDIPTVDLQTGGMVSRRVDGGALARVVRRHVQPGWDVLVTCEAVQAQPNGTIQSQGSLMRSLGAIEAVFDCLRWPCQMVAPQRWQGMYDLKGKKTQKRERGELPAATVLARSLYPTAASSLTRVKDHNKAEALLIAHWGRRQFEG